METKKEKEQFINVKTSWNKLIRKYTLDNGKTVTINHAEIELLCMISGFEKCTASRAYFADALNVSEHTITKYITDLHNIEVLKTFEDKQGSKTINTTRYVQEDVIEKLIGGVPNRTVTDDTSVPNRTENNNNTVPNGTGVCPEQDTIQSQIGLNTVPNGTANNIEYQSNKKEDNIDNDTDDFFDDILCDHSANAPTVTNNKENDKQKNNQSNDIKSKNKYSNNQTNNQIITLFKQKHKYREIVDIVNKSLGVNIDFDYVKKVIESYLAECETKQQPVEVKMDVEPEFYESKYVPRKHKIPLSAYTNKL